MGTDNPTNGADAGVDNNRTKENGNTTSIRLADKIHCIRTNNITDEYELKEEIGVSVDSILVCRKFKKLKEI